MREIKYRAWDKIEKKMYMDVHMQYDGRPNDMHARSFGEVLTEPIEDEYPFSGEKRYVPIQYTGLKDKNGDGVEVYEGDILKNINMVYPITVETCNGYRFMFGSYQLRKSNLINGEVIGNIYENPELLK